MTTTDKISNINGTWFLAEIIEKCEPKIVKNSNDMRRVVTHSNFHLINADSASHAYEKAYQLGKEKEYEFLSNKILMRWVFIGIGNLIPIYEEFIEDGAEILWRDYGNISNKKAMSFAASKKEILENVKLKP